MYGDLRGKQQLGYYVGCSKKLTCGIHGVTFMVQSAQFNPVHLEAKILKFIEKFFINHLIDDEETFQKYKSGTATRLR